MVSEYEKICASADYIKEHTSHRPGTGIILGSGLGDIVDAMEEKEVIPYADIPGFPCSKVAGHKGNLVFGRINGTTVVAMQGRVHFYEGMGMKKVVYPVYVMKMLGIRNLIVTNACGGINPQFQPGDLMLLTDYINLTGMNPLIGDNDERLGVRFPDMSEAYSEELRKVACEAASRNEISYKTGVYALFPGPCYESAAEIRAYAALGADAIGMSTVPETIAANYAGIRTLGIACITNMATGIAKEKHFHEEVLKIANESSEKLCRWVKEIVREL